MEATETIAMGGTAASPGPSCTGKIETSHASTTQPRQERQQHQRWDRSFQL